MPATDDLLRRDAGGYYYFVAGRTGERFMSDSNRVEDIGIILRREIEARIVGPLLGALGEEFGRERVLEIAGRVIVELAREHGAALATECGDNSLTSFAGCLPRWTKGDALELHVLEQSDSVLAFDVTRCRYAEMYRTLGLADLGATLSCNRDFSLIEGFNPSIHLTRTQTIMSGASCCDFRFRAEEK
jgi:hypothetical protein